MVFQELNSKANLTPYLEMVYVIIIRASQVALVVKNLLANAGDAGSVPGSGRSPGAGNGNPLHYSCLENPMDRRARRATARGVAESGTRLRDWSAQVGSSVCWLSAHMWAVTRAAAEKPTWRETCTQDLCKPSLSLLRRVRSPPP